MADEAAKTTAWTAQAAPPTAPLTLSNESFDDEDDLPPRRHRGLYFALAGVVVIGAGLAIAWAASGSDGHTNSRGSEGNAPSASRGERWWTPPDAKRTSIEALAYAFATIGEDNLGDFFDKDLQPVYGSGSFFEEHEPKRAHRDEVFHAFVRLNNRLQLRAGFDVLLARAGGSYSAEKAYQLYRAMQVREVVFVDEDKRMREPPERAVFYLAEIHRGHAYDVLMEGDHREVGVDLDLKVKVPVKASAYFGSNKVKINAQGLGLAPVGGEAIFAITPDDIAHRYRSSGEPVIVKLVFRTIPGRGVRKQELPGPKVIVDEMWTLADGKRREVAISTGRYHIAAESAPKGLHLSVIGDATCVPPLPRGNEYDRVNSKCTVARGGQLLFSNYTDGLWNGPVERMSVYVAKLPD